MSIRYTPLPATILLGSLLLFAGTLRAVDPVLGNIRVAPTFVPAGAPTLVSLTASIPDTTLLSNGATSKG